MSRSGASLGVKWIRKCHRQPSIKCFNPRQVERCEIKFITELIFISPILPHSAGTDGVCQTETPWEECFKERKLGELNPSEVTLGQGTCQGHLQGAWFWLLHQSPDWGGREGWDLPGSPLASLRALHWAAYSQKEEHLFLNYTKALHGLVVPRQPCPLSEKAVRGRALTWGDIGISSVCMLRRCDHFASAPLLAPHGYRRGEELPCASSHPTGNTDHTWEYQALAKGD